MRGTCWILILLGLGLSAKAQSSRPGVGATPYGDASGTGVTFRVWAPNATEVSVPGTFNGWSTTATPLVQEGGAGTWSADVSAARPGHHYKFLLNGSLWKRDPRGRLVEHTAGNSIVYDPSAFNWAGDRRLAPRLNELVIYELHVGAFHDSTPGDGLPGDFDDAIARVDYLAWLGVNAVELMPVAEFAGDYSWGYNPADLYAVERAGYGGPDGLKRFVRACHARGIAVLLDVVHNHYGPGQMDLWNFDGGSNGGIYFYESGGICCTAWGSRPDYSREGVRSFIRDHFRTFLDEYHVDGFRWDAVGAMLNYDAGDGTWPYIPEGASLIADINGMMAAEYPGAIRIAEDRAGTLGFDSEWAHWAHNIIVDEMSIVSDGDRDVGNLWTMLNGGRFERVVFSESHDTVGELNAGSRRLPVAIDAGDPGSYWARKRSMLGTALALAAPAVPMLFMGQEMLTPERFSDRLPLDWSRTNSQARVVRFHRDLIRIRRNLDGVSEGMLGTEISLRVLDNGAKMLAVERGGPGLRPCLVIVNASVNPILDYPVTFPSSGTWYANLDLDDPDYGADFLGAGSGLVEVTGGQLMAGVSVGPYSLMVFSQWAHPDRDADGDGLPNGWETEHFGGPTLAQAGEDPDGDGLSNRDEFQADTLPGDINSVLRIQGIRRAGEELEVTWQGGVAARQLVSGMVPGTSAWVPLHTNVPPTGLTNQVQIGGTGEGVGRYRIEIDGAAPP